MAQRRQDQISNVLPQIIDEGPNALQSIAEFAKPVVDQMLKAELDARTLENQTDMTMALNQLNNEHRIKYAADPNSKQSLDEFQAQKQKIISSYAENVPFINRSRFLASANGVSQNIEISNQAWRFKQAEKNAINATNSVMRKNLSSAYQNARSFGETGTFDPASVLNFEEQRDSLLGLMQKYMPPEQAEKEVRKFSTDARKVTIMGLTETNPRLAAQYLDEIKKMDNDLDPTEISTYEKMITSGLSRVDFNTQVENYDYKQNLMGVLDDPNIPTIDKIEEINRARVEGRVTAGFAADYKKLLEDPKEKTANRDPSVYVDLLLAQDTIKRMKPKDEAKEIVDEYNLFQDNVMKAVAEGKISQGQANELLTKVKPNEVRAQAYGEIIKDGGTSWWKFGATDYSDIRDMFEEKLGSKSLANNLFIEYYNQYGEDFSSWDNDKKKQTAETLLEQVKEGSKFFNSNEAANTYLSTLPQNATPPPIYVNGVLKRIGPKGQ